MGRNTCSPPRLAASEPTTLLLGSPVSTSTQADATADYSARLPGRRRLGGEPANSRALAVNPVTAPTYIVGPLAGGQLATLFPTQPPVRERIQRLRATTAVAPRAASDDPPLHRASGGSA
jgi:hypothetical protein